MHLNLTANAQSNKHTHEVKKHRNLVDLALPTCFKELTSALSFLIED